MAPSKSAKKELLEIVIIGSGIAGMSAAIYAARKRMRFKLLSQDIGGQINVAGEIENYPGFKQINYTEFMAKLNEQLEHNGITPHICEVASIAKNKDGTFTVKTDEGDFHTIAVLVASGGHPRKLNVPGEDAFKNRGVTYCAVCDGPLFKERTVAIIGGGNSGFEAAEFMLRIAKKIYILELDKIRAYEYLRERVLKQPNVELIEGAAVKEIRGKTMVEGLTYEKNKKQQDLKVGGVFIEIGRVPSTEFLRGLADLDKGGRIMVNKFMETSCEGIWAAGDCTDVYEDQFVIAGGQGVTALLRASKYIAQKEGKPAPQAAYK